MKIYEMDESKFTLVHVWMKGKVVKIPLPIDNGSLATLVLTSMATF